MRDFRRNDRGRDRGGGRFGGRDSGGRNFGGNDRMMHHAVCASCGKDCEVPFRPSGDRPVYCSDCFEKKRNEGGYSGDRGGGRNFNKPNSGDRHQDFAGRGDSRNRPGQDFGQITQQLKSLNEKLDKIISILEPKTERSLLVKDDVTAIVAKPKPEVKAKKAKKKAKEEKFPADETK